MSQCCLNIKSLDRSQCHSSGAGFSRMLNSRVVGLRVLPRFQKNWEARQYGPERIVCEAVRIKLKV